MLPPPLFTLNFNRATISSVWNNDAGAFTSQNQQQLKSNGIGEIIYAGETLDDIVGILDAEDSDFALWVKIRGTEDAKFTIRGRRQDANNYIGLSVDFENDIIKLVKSVDGNERIEHQVSHNLKFVGAYRYIFELWMQGNNIHGFVNGYNIVSTATASFKAEPGFSIYVPETNFSDPVSIYEVRSFEIVEPNEPSLNPSDLTVDFRLRIKDEIENPSERTWATYKKAQSLYTKHKDQGMSNEEWEEFGYPIREPSSEEWFGNE